MPYKDAGMRRKAVKESMRKLRGMVVIGDVNPEDVNPYGEECEPLCEPLVSKYIPNYDINPKHKDGCRCMLCAPDKWPDLKVDFVKMGVLPFDADRKVYMNYDIHPAHAKNCDCMCCLGGVNGKDGKFKLMKDLLAGF